MSQHEQMLQEIGDAIMSAGRGILPHVAGIGVVRQVAENSSEVEINGSDHKTYVLSIIEKDGAE